MDCSRQKYWSWLPFPTPGDLPNPGIKPISPASAGEFFTTAPPGKPSMQYYPGVKGTSYSKSPTYKPSSCELSTMLIAFRQRQMWVKLQLALRLLLLTIFWLHHLPPPFLAPVSNCPCLFTRCQPLYASCSTFKVLSCKIKSFIFCVCFLCVLCVKVL